MADMSALPGFDPHWQSVPDFILGTGWEVWEGRSLATLRDVCTPEIICRDAGGAMRGPAALVADTLATLAEFPDLQVLGEDVIWCATPKKDGPAAGFHASHRMTAQGRHGGQGRYGAATGRRVGYRVIADSWCADGRVQDRWQVADTGALLRQLGHDPREWVAAGLGAPGPARVPALTPDSDAEGPYLGGGDGGTHGNELAAILRELMAGGFSVIPERFDRACALGHPGGQDGIGHGMAERFWLGLRAAFPSAAFRIEHVCGLSEPGAAPRAAVRWTLYGKHDGPGRFGTPTGCFVYVMGITHAEFGPRGIRREWTVIDEAAIWRQILGAAG